MMIFGFCVGCLPHRFPFTFSAGVSTMNRSGAHHSFAAGSTESENLCFVREL